MTISQRIFSIMKAKNLSQKALSEYADISPAAISSWKSKNTNPSSDKIIKICEFLDVSPFYLLSGQDEDADDLILTDAANGYSSTLTKEEANLLQMFRQLSDLNKGRILGMLEALAAPANILE